MDLLCLCLMLAPALGLMMHIIIKNSFSILFSLIYTSISADSGILKNGLDENTESFTFRFYSFCSSGFVYGAKVGALLSIPVITVRARNVLRTNGELNESELISFVLEAVGINMLVTAVLGTSIAAIIFLPKEVISFCLFYW